MLRMMAFLLLPVLILIPALGCDNQDREETKAPQAAEQSRALTGEYKKEAETARISLGRDGVAVTITKETRKASESPHQEARMARQEAETVLAAVRQARRKVEALQKEQEIQKKEQLVQNAAAQVALAEVGYNTDLTAQSSPDPVYTDDLNLLYNYGLRVHPDLIYKIDLFSNTYGPPDFRVTVRHKDPGPRAFRYESGVGLTPVETAP